MAWHRRANSSPSRPVPKHQLGCLGPAVNTFLGLWNPECLARLWAFHQAPSALPGQSHPAWRKMESQNLTQGGCCPASRRRGQLWGYGDGQWPPTLPCTSVPTREQAWGRWALVHRIEAPTLALCRGSPDQKARYARHERAGNHATASPLAGTCVDSAQWVLWGLLSWINSKPTLSRSWTNPEPTPHKPQADPK